MRPAVLLAAAVVSLAVLARTGAVRWLQSPIGHTLMLVRHWGLLHWHGHSAPDDLKCLAVKLEPERPGTPVHLWNCMKRDPNQHWVFPRRHGLIHWSLHDHLCLRPQFGALHPGTPIVLDKCDVHDKSMIWSMTGSDETTGAIRLRHAQELCIGENGNWDGAQALLKPCPKPSEPPNGDQRWKGVLHGRAVTGQLRWGGPSGRDCLRAPRLHPGAVLSLSNCEDDRSTTFVFPVGFGEVSSAARPELCVDLSHGGAVFGSRAVLRKCHQGGTAEWKPPEGTGATRLRGGGGRLCLQPQANGRSVRLEACGQAERWNVHEAHLDASLYCVSVIRPNTEEQWLIQSQIAHADKTGHDAGVFSCNAFDLFAAWAVELGHHSKHGKVVARYFKQGPALTWRNGHPQNSVQFAHLWMAVKKRGVYHRHDWTVKLDPDTVFVASKMRRHLSNHPPGAHFMETCGGWWQNGNKGRVMFGPVEALSRKALVRYFSGRARCQADPNWRVMGEDVYLDGCLRSLGARPLWSHGFVFDKNCAHGRAPQCGEQYAAFHPFKSKAEWWSCYHTALHT